MLPRGEPDIHFRPVVVTRHIPDPAAEPWPKGDKDAATPLPHGVDTGAIASALDWGMAQREHNTRAASTSSTTPSISRWRSHLIPNGAIATRIR